MTKSPPFNPSGPEVPIGLYDQVITEQMRHALAALAENGYRIRSEGLDPEEAHETLAASLAEVIIRALRAQPVQDHLARQIDICNRLLDGLAATGDRAGVGPDDHLTDQKLVEISAAERWGATGKDGLQPAIPLGQTELLVNAPRDHRVGAEVEKEIASADSIDLLCSFIKWSGYIRVRPALERHCASGKPLRVITTTYMGATEARALQELHRLGGQVRISYDNRRTRLHAKAWYFHRATGFDTAFIGSSNLSAAALTDGLEWNVRVSAKQLPKVAAKFRATFENYWNDSEFESYDPDADAGRLERSLRASSFCAEPLLAYLDVAPYPFQQEILDQIWAERQVHNRWRNLVVAATGTGKTLVSAFDYKRACKTFGTPLRLLFVAHRQEILEQSLSVFRQVLKQGDFGELMVGGAQASRGEHVFASVQSLANIPLDSIPPKHFDMIVVDEVHHAAAATYERLLQHLQPTILLGLTATPERADGESILPWFGGRIAAELRLWDAIDRCLLASFQYFVLNDDVDLSSIGWSKGRYNPSELENVYTGNEARVRLILQAIHRYLPDPGRMKALGFCVSVKHAEYMAAQFQKAGIAAEALTASTPADKRRAMKLALARGEINVLFTVDLFNEGVDIPDADTVLFLRPTESATLFLQQLGRGLRRTDDKECLTVLDFVGRIHSSFRFDLRLRALTGATRQALRRQVEEGFPYLPSGCSIQMDRVAQQAVLENLKQALSRRWVHLVVELRAHGHRPDLATFLQESEVELDEVYSQGRNWTKLRREAGWPIPQVDPQEQEALDALARCLHWDDPEMLKTALVVASGKATELASAGGYKARLLAMVLTSLYGPMAPAEPMKYARLCEVHEVLRDELKQLVEVLQDRSSHQPVDDPQMSTAGVPLRPHCHYSRDEIMAAHQVIRSGKLHQVREGVFYDQQAHHDLLFMTLQKSEKDYSPSTMYQDYAISPTLFHWQSQSQTRAGSTTGQRYVGHQAMGVTPLLFVRQRKKSETGVTSPYLFLGPATYSSHTGERPMSIVWRLRYPMPMDTFRDSKVAAG